MDSETSRNVVAQLRLVVEADDFDDAVGFYRDVLGLSEEFYVESDGGARVIALQAGRATLEIVNAAQKRLIDDLEVGHQVSRSIRVAFEVPDAISATDRLRSRHHYSMTAQITITSETGKPGYCTQRKMAP